VRAPKPKELSLGFVWFAFGLLAAGLVLTDLFLGAPSESVLVDERLSLASAPGYAAPFALDDETTVEASMTGAHVTAPVSLHHRESGSVYEMTIREGSPAHARLPAGSYDVRVEGRGVDADLSLRIVAGRRNPWPLAGAFGLLGLPPLWLLLRRVRRAESAASEPRTKHAFDGGIE
jgi:hypothetical protein